MSQQKNNTQIVAIVTMCFIFAMISFVTNMGAPFGNIWGFTYPFAKAWGNPEPTAEQFQAIKDGGFNTVRIPTTWYQHIQWDDSSKMYLVNDTWMDYVKSTVDFAIDRDMFVILNVHHEDWVNVDVFTDDTYKDAEKKLTEGGYAQYYLYRQSKMLSNLENIGWAKKGFFSPYNVYIMEETHSILACGAGAVTKLRDADSDWIERIFNFKYPYEYISRFDELIERKARINSFYGEYNK
jgi:hypothetical protein